MSELVVNESSYERGPSTIIVTKLFSNIPSHDIMFCFPMGFLSHHLPTTSCAKNSHYAIEMKPECCHSSDMMLHRTFDNIIRLKMCSCVRCNEL
mmetsp:Transcript_16952/g.35587  ORF Transcript_16952/g.35587 Transcript_16952/m.35587 type:complete len:94 (+) Transcript_16952:714-995(+)